MNTSTPGRQRVVAVLVLLAVAGAVIWYFAPKPSLLRDLGALMMVLWLPVIGNVIAYIGNKLPRAAPPPLAFEPGLPFAAHLVVDVTGLAQPVHALTEPQDPEQHLFTVVVGRDGFRVRPPRAPASYLGTQEANGLELEFLRPKQGVPRFPVGTAFRLLWGATAVGKGVVTSTLQPASDAVPAPPTRS